ncbi:MAG TPA: carboxyltransferase domain-containing protein [Aliiroseovarius sp.]|nr:carboxyltransferase domain-containing protein [Aliiroseovarius sp.]
MDQDIAHPPPQILPFGADALIVRFSVVPDPAANIAAQVFAGQVAALHLAGLVEIVPSLASVLVRFDPAKTRRADIVAQLRPLADSRDWSLAAPPPAKRRWTIPAAFDGAFGPQFGEAAQQAGRSETAALADLTSARLRVLAIGFAPGQPYLGLLPEHWDLPRQQALTPQVPAGALVVALRQVVLFANPSATGWRWVGQTAFRPFRADLDQPFMLQTGDEVVFDPVDASTMSDLLAAGTDGADRARLELLS